LAWEEVLSNEQLLGITEQLILLSAFLGGFSATFLAAILVFDPKKNIAIWVVGLSAVSACSFVVCATSSIALVNGLQAIQEELETGLVTLQSARIISGLSMAIGLFSLLASIGVSGWLRNKKTGIATSSVAAIAIIIVGVLV